MSASRLEMLKKMVAGGSQDPFHHYALAMELRNGVEDLEASLAAFGATRDRFPDYVPTYLMAAQVAQELERDDEARAWAEQGIARAEAAGDDHAKRELSQLLMLL